MKTKKDFSPYVCNLNKAHATFLRKKKKKLEGLIKKIVPIMGFKVIKRGSNPQYKAQNRNVGSRLQYLLLYIKIHLEIHI